MWWLWVLLGVVALVVAYDVTQRRHAVLRNFPIIGHFRYWLEAIGPELRQYIVTNNDEEKPFSRDERRWVYASAKRDNNYFGFGSDNDFEGASDYLIIKHEVLSSVPLDAERVWKERGFAVPCAKVLGRPRGRRHAFRPTSVVNVSAMSFGSLSGPAVEALNRGCALAGCLHNTGEGGVSPHHRHGGDLVWQIGTGYFGCRDAAGRFSSERFLETLASAPVKAIELKLSQGAKPGVGGILPAAKVTPEIAAIRGIELGRDCISPPSHSAFRSVDELLDFVERLADTSGLPIGIKSAVGEERFWSDLAGAMERRARGVDFVTIDGGEGGTGAGPLVFADHVALPFRAAFPRVYRQFAERGLHEDVVFIGSAKLGFPESAALAFAMGCDMVNVAREAMLAIGCIQAQRCHTGRCPTGVATQNRWLARGLHPPSKGDRLAGYFLTLRHELLSLSRACGVPHPALIPLERFEFVDHAVNSWPASERFGYREGWGLPSAADREEIAAIMLAGVVDA